MAALVSRRSQLRWPVAASILVIVLASLMTGRSAAQEPAALGTSETTSLRWKLAVGDRFHVVAEQIAKQVVPIGGQNFEIPLQLAFEADWAIESLEDDGTAKILQTLTRITFATKSPFLGEIRLDTEEPPPTDDPLGIDRLLRSLVGVKADLKLDPFGRTSDFAIRGELPEAWTNNDSNRLIGIQQLAPLGSNGGGVVLPDQPVAIGASWKHSQSLPLANVGQLQQDFTLTYAGPSENGKLRRIEMVADVQLQAQPSADDPKVTFALKESKVAGTAWFDSLGGHLDSVSLRTTMVVATEVDGMLNDARSTIEMNTRFERLSR